MASFTVIVLPSALKELSNLDRTPQGRILKALTELETNPRPSNCKKLVGSPYWRIRVGEYRVVYSIEDKILTIEVIRIAHRKEVYR